MASPCDLVSACDWLKEALEDMERSILNKFLDMDIPAFDCLVYYKGEEVYRRLAGYGDYEKTRALSTEQRFYIY